MASILLPGLAAVLFVTSVISFSCDFNFQCYNGNYVFANPNRTKYYGLKGYFANGTECINLVGSEGATLLVCDCDMVSIAVELLDINGTVIHSCVMTCDQEQRSQAGLSLPLQFVFETQKIVHTNSAHYYCQGSGLILVRNPRIDLYTHFLATENIVNGQTCQAPLILDKQVVEISGCNLTHTIILIACNKPVTTAFIMRSSDLFLLDCGILSQATDDGEDNGMDFTCFEDGTVIAYNPRDELYKYSYAEQSGQQCTTLFLNNNKKILLSSCDFVIVFMGGTLSCAGKGGRPKDEDRRPYGPPIVKSNGIVAPSQKYIVPQEEAKPTNNNNDDKPVSNFTRQPSWRFWQRLSLRRTDKPDPRKQIKLPPFLEDNTPLPSERLPDVVDTKGAFRRSWSLKPPPKPPRLFFFRSSTINTPRSSVVGETDRNSFILSQAYQTGSKGTDNSKPVTVTEPKDENREVKSLRDSISEPMPNVIQAIQSSRSLETYQNVPIPQSAPKDIGGGTVHSGTVVVRRSPLKSPTGKIKIVSPELSRKVAARSRKRSSQITAEDRHVLIMQSASELICQKLDPFTIIEDLHKADILGKEDLTAYRGHPDRRLICENIIQAVTDKEYSAFLRFCDVLRDITDYATVAAVLDAMRGIYDVIHEIPASRGDKSPILDDEKTISFDVVYYSLESGKIRSVVELEKARASESRRFSRDFMLSNRHSRLSFHSLTSEASSIFMEDIINTGIPMVTVAIAGHDLSDDKAKGLASVIEQNSCILELHVGKTHLKGPDMEPLFRSLQFTSGLRVLDLRLNSIGNEGAYFIASSLQTNRTLRQLNLSSTGIGAEGCKHLAESLRYNTTLAELDLSFLDVGDTGCMALGSALKQNRGLQKLRLRSDNISWIGAGFLIEGIEVSKILTELDLSRNFIGDDGAEMLARHLGDNSSLREINLENCGFTSVGCSMLSDLILTNKSIVHLDLSTNFIGDQGILRLSNALERNKSIRTLGLNMCGITNDGFAKLLDILEANPTLRLLKLCYNRLGREHTNPEATSDSLKYRIRIVTSSNPKLKLLLWGNTFDESLNTISQMTRDITATL